MLQVLLNGLIQGLLFATVGVAFSLVYATTRVFHLALGATFVMSPYMLQACLEAGLPWQAGALASVLAAIGLGLAVEEFIHWPLELKRAPGEIHLIASLGAFLIIGQLVALIWGNDAQVLVSGIDSVYQIGSLRLTAGQVIAALVAALLLASTFALLDWSDLGLQFRAMATNAPLLATFGRNIRGLRRSAFALSGALAAIAALLAARDVGFDPDVGMRTILVGIAATIVGGRGSFVGTAIAGILFGVLRAQVVWHSSARWEDAATFVVLALFLLFVPAGLSGRSGRRTRIEDMP